MKVAEERRFKDYRTDLTLDMRQLRVALRRLRQLTRSGEATELDLDETIDETCKNAGEIELVFRPPRRNDVRLLLLMDVGGTMDPYYEPVSQLLTALHEDHGLRDFQPYYFHNCVYDHVYSSARMHARRRRADRRRPAPPRQSLEGGRSSATPPCTRPSCSRPTATSIRAGRRRPPASPGCSASPTTSIARVWLNPEETAYWDGRTPRRHPPPLPDVPPQRRRPHRRRCRRWSAREPKSRSRAPIRAATWSSLLVSRRPLARIASSSSAAASAASTRRKRSGAHRRK